MATNFISGEKFDKTDFKKEHLKQGEYEECSFQDCDFTENDFSDTIFTDCTFVRCNISLVKLKIASFQDVTFTGCKMMGLHFDDCNEFGLSFHFDACILDHSSFYKTTVRDTLFKNCKLHECDFTECDLTGSTFDNCDLFNAMFDHSNLEKVDYRTAYNYSINPEINRFKKTRFSSSGLAGLLGKYDLRID